jgi:large subunit ribosomal protein L35
MPKMKTHSGAKKRFKLTAKGKVRGRHAFSSHILEKKSPKRKRGFRKPMDISDHDAPRVKTLLGAKSTARRAGGSVKSAGRTPAGGDS